MFFALIFATKTFAQDASTIQNKIDSQNQAITNLQAEIDQYQAQLTTLGKSKDTLANKLAELSLESKKLAANILITQNKITQKDIQIKSLGNSIVDTGGKITLLKKSVALNIQELQISESSSGISDMLVSGNIYNLWHYIGEQNSFQKSIRAKNKELADTKTILITSKTQVEKAKKDLVSLQSQLKDQKTINQKTQDQQKTLLASTKNQESQYQKMVAAKQKIKDQMQADLNNYESQLKYVLNKSTLPQSGTAVLSWPLDIVKITQSFGKTSDSGRLYASGTHNGVDFAASIGTPVRAMADGVVIDDGNSDLSCAGASYGNWILISYNVGLASTYGHLSLIKVTPGQKVSRGDIVGYSGVTGYATGPHLHVSMYPRDGVKVGSFPSKACKGKTLTVPLAANNAYLDPMQYLPKL